MQPVSRNTRPANDRRSVPFLEISLTLLCGEARLPQPTSEQSLGRQGAGWKALPCLTAEDPRNRQREQVWLYTAAGKRKTRSKTNLFKVDDCRRIIIHFRNMCISLAFERPLRGILLNIS